MPTDLSKLCIHTITTKPWSLETAIEKYTAAGIGGISVWQNAVEDIGVEKAGALLRNSDLEVVSYVRGGFFPSTSEAARQQAIDNNKKLIDEAATIGAPLLVLVCGAEPKQSLGKSRQQIQEGIEAILSHAEANNVKLGIEPLHPMYADTRSAVNTLAQANTIAENINADGVGVVVDVYHLWWDEDLEEEIQRCGDNGHLQAFHICDWKVPTEDMLNDRGLMGEGCINVPQIRTWVENAGFDGFTEVEIFSNRYWAMNQDDFLQQIIEAYQKHS